MALGKRNKRPPPLRNQAVQTVGRPYFVLGMLGMTVAGIIGILTIALGSTHGMFKFDLDRCDCLVTSSIESHRDAGTSCTYGEDFIGVNIGWKSFVIENAVSTDGCLDGWEGTVDIGTPFGDGIYKKKSKTYGNGATGAADACVWLFVLSAVLAIVAYKTIKMSYTGPGSIYSIGLHNISGMCLLLSIASAISVAAFWGRIQGRLGSLSSSVAFTLYNATIDACEDDWDEVRVGTFCDAEPWEFEVPLFAGMMGIAHVAVMFLTSVWVLSKSAFVEGLLDGSVLISGKAVTAVGRALATTEDPDYDADNMLYTGEQNIMIRPYPLPSTVKHKVVKSGEPLVSPLRQMSPRTGGQSGFSKRTPDKARKSPSTNNSRGFNSGRPQAR